MANLRNLGREMVKAKNPELHKSLFGSTASIFGQLILEKRMSKGISQDDLALMANTTQKTISRVEGGNSNVTMDTYDKLFDALNISPEERGQAFLKKAERGNEVIVGANSIYSHSY